MFVETKKFRQLELHKILLIMLSCGLNFLEHCKTMAENHRVSARLVYFNFFTKTVRLENTCPGRLCAPSKMCMEEHRICDDPEDCKDGSDETFHHCSKFSQEFPIFQSYYHPPNHHSFGKCGLILLENTLRMLKNPVKIVGSFPKHANSSCSFNESNHSSNAFFLTFLNLSRLGRFQRGCFKI